MVQVDTSHAAVGFLYGKINHMEYDYVTVINTLLNKKRMTRAELAPVLQVSRQAVYKKFNTNKFTAADLHALNAFFNVDIMKIASKAGNEIDVLNMVNDPAVQYERTADYTINLSSEEAKEILLAQTRTINDLRAQMDELRKQFLEFKKS